MKLEWAIEEVTRWFEGYKDYEIKTTEAISLVLSAARKHLEHHGSLASCYTCAHEGAPLDAHCKDCNIYRENWTPKEE